MLTHDELDVLADLGEVFNAFCALPELHPSDRDDFARYLHALQNLVMSRVAVREHPSFFTSMHDARDVSNERGG